MTRARYVRNLSHVGVGASQELTLVVLSHEILLPSKQLLLHHLQVAQQIFHASNLATRSPLQFDTKVHIYDLYTPANYWMFDSGQLSGKTVLRSDMKRATLPANKATSVARTRELFIRCQRGLLFEELTRPTMSSRTIYHSN